MSDFPVPRFDWKEHGLVSGENFHVSSVRSVGGYSFPTHEHVDFWEWAVPLKGRLLHEFPGERVEEDGPGAARLLRPGDRHALRGSGIHFVNLVIPGVWLNRFSELWEIPRMADAFLGAKEAPSVKLSSGDFRLLREKLLLSLDHRTGPVARRAVSDALSLLFGGLLEELPTLSPSRGEGRPAWLRQVVRHFEEHLEEQMNMEDVADRAGLSFSHFSRTFAAHCGRSPLAHLNHLRLERAANRLAGTDEPVTAICQGVGYRDLGHFIRSFRRRFGESPLGWRRRHAPSGSRAPETGKPRV